jgi:hypothetical protein
MKRLATTTKCCRLSLACPRAMAERPSSPRPSRAQENILERAVQDQLVRNGAGSRHPGKYEPLISTLGLERWRWVGVGLEKRLDSSQARVRPCLNSERELYIHSNSQRCRLLPCLAALRRRRRRQVPHPHRYPK